MYYEKLMPILADLESKDVEVAGGSVVPMVLSIINALIDYICNLTKDKKNYQNVREEVLKIKEECEELRRNTLKAIDQDEKILKEILDAYKKRNNEEPEKLEEVSKKSAEFCIEVTENALNTLKLAKRISEIGNRMLSSDFKICMLYAFTSVEAGIENVKINVDSVKDEAYKNTLTEKYKKLYEEAKDIYNAN